MKSEISTAEQLYEQIRARGLILFGAGYVAGLWLRILRRDGLEDRLRCILVSAPKERSWNGLPVMTPEELTASLSKNGSEEELPLLGIAVHEVLRKEILPRLEQSYPGPVVFLYPFLQASAFGGEIRWEWIPVARILQAQPRENRWITLRYGVLQADASGLPEQKQLAENIYLKMQSAFSSPETAARRLARFRDLAARSDAVDILQKEPILLQEDLQVIDGLHRLALAAFLGIPAIPCRIAAHSDLYDILFTGQNRGTPAARTAAGLTEAERRLLEEMKENLETQAAETPVEKMPLVSVIIPVYNVAPWLPQCLESVCGQTMTDFEVLLIDDGSKDESWQICLDWAEKDARIRCFHQENAGVSAARNKGIENARGTFLAFVDSDDWLDPSYLEKLYQALEESGAPFAECDLWRCSNRDGSKIYRSCSGRMGVDYTWREHMKYAPTASYKAMSRRSLWMDHDIRFPSCSFESPAIFSLVLAESGRMASVKEALYYYRRFRENSLIESGYAAKDGAADLSLGVDAMAYLLEGFRSRGLAEEYKDLLPAIVCYRLSDILATQFHRRTKEEFARIVENYRSFLASAFPERPRPVYLTWGGYNLNRILTHMDLLHDPSGRFNFSSLISLVGEAPELPAMTHKNKYRAMMLAREHTRAFREILRERQPDWLVLDLIEERFDILRYGGAYVTKSDAWEGILWKDPKTGEPVPAPEPEELISRDSEACGSLWRRAAELFFRNLKADCPKLRILVIENYLAEEVGDIRERTAFPELQEIRRTNEILRGYYAFLREMLPEAEWISPAADELYFTDRNYEYGAIPSHLNEIENQRIGEMAESRLLSSALSAGS